MGLFFTRMKQGMTDAILYMRCIDDLTTPTLLRGNAESARKSLSACSSSRFSGHFFWRIPLYSATDSFFDDSEACCGALSHFVISSRWEWVTLNEFHRRMLSPERFGENAFC